MKPASTNAANAWLIFCVSKVENVDLESWGGTSENPTLEAGDENTVFFGFLDGESGVTEFTLKFGSPAPNGLLADQKGAEGNKDQMQ